MTDLRTRIAAALYARAIERLGWNRSWDNLGAPSQQLWLDDADAVIRELQSDYTITPKSQSSYADHFCPGGCDCSCCYGAYDVCHCLNERCNCGGDRADHSQKPLGA